MKYYRFRYIVTYNHTYTIEADSEDEATEMVRLLTHGHEQVVKTSREALKLAQDADDESSAALVSLLGSGPSFPRSSDLSSLSPKI